MNIRHGPGRDDRRVSAGLVNGINSVFEHDLNDRLTRITHAKDAASIFDIDYGYDENGNRLWKRFNAVSGPNDMTDRSEVYSYDNRDRLTVMSRGTMAAGTSPTIAAPLVHPSLAKSQSWQNLDRRGNWREFRELVGASSDITQTREPNAINQYTQIDPDGPGGQEALSLQSDAAGNLTRDPTARSFEPAAQGQSYEYDEENRLVAVRRNADAALLMEIRYDAVGRRVETIQHIDPTAVPPLTEPRHTRHIYDGLETIEEYVCDTSDPACTGWALAREFVWGSRFPEPVAMVSHVEPGVPVGGSGPTWVYHYLHDALGSVIGLASADGAIVERYTYDPYGKSHVEFRFGSGWVAVEASANGGAYSALGNPFLWTGQRYDAGVELYHFMYRSYSPALGRWLQKDPLGYAGGSLSLFEYVRSEPVLWIDRRGLFPGDPEWNDGLVGDAEEAYASHIDEIMVTINSASEVAAAALEFTGELIIAAAATMVPTPGDELAAASMLTSKLRRLVESLGEAAEKSQKARKLPEKAKRLLEKSRKKTEELKRARVEAKNDLGCKFASSDNRGSIYKVPGDGTPSGKPYIGRHNQPDPKKARHSNDGRDRKQAEVIDTYDSKDVKAGREKEQKAIDQAGGIENLDNKRNEIEKKD